MRKISIHGELKALLMRVGRKTLLLVVYFFNGMECIFGVLRVIFDDNFGQQFRYINFSAITSSNVLKKN